MTSLEFPISPLGDESKLEDLVARARDGNHAAFNALTLRVRDRVRGWAARLTNDDDDAEDVAQLVLLRLHRQLAEFEGRSRFTTWLYAVTKRMALSRRARDHRRAGLLGARRAEAEGDRGNDASATRSEDGKQGAGLVPLIASYLDVLAGRERDVFELADLRGLNSAEIAARLGVKAVTIRTQLMRARRKIRLRMLEDHPYLLEDYRE